MIYAQPGIPPLENEIHRIRWNFEIQTDHLIPARRLDVVLITHTHTHTHTQKKERRKNSPNKGLCLPADGRVKIKWHEKNFEYLDLASELKNEYVGDTETDCNWRVWNDTKRLGKKAERNGNQRTSGDHPNNNNNNSNNNNNNDGWRPSKRQHYWERPEYWEESWRLEKTCCHSDSSEKPSANADVKNSNEWIIIIMIIIILCKQL